MKPEKKAWPQCNPHIYQGLVAMGFLFTRLAGPSITQQVTLNGAVENQLDFFWDGSKLGNKHGSIPPSLAPKERFAMAWRKAFFVVRGHFLRI
jgi:hypothetical protein